MNRLLDVVVLNVGDDPDIAGILAKGISRELTGLWSFEMPLARILLRYTDGVKVEDVVV